MRTIRRWHDRLVHAVHCWAYPDLHVRYCVCRGSGRLPADVEVIR